MAVETSNPERRRNAASAAVDDALTIATTWASRHGHALTAFSGKGPERWAECCRCGRRVVVSAQLLGERAVALAFSGDAVEDECD